MQKTSQLIQIAINKQAIQYYSYLRSLIQQNQASYWIGNPSVQIINGNIQLYPLYYSHQQSLKQSRNIKHLTQQCQTLDSYLSILQNYSSSFKHELRKKQLILQGIPNSKPPAEVLQILKPYSQSIQQIRVIKTVDIKHYAMLILMKSQKDSQFLHQQLFAQQYNSLEIQRIILRQIKQISLCFSELLKAQGLANQMKLLRQVKSQGQKMKAEYIFMSTHKRLIKLTESPQKKLINKRKMSQGSIQQPMSPQRKQSQVTQFKKSPKSTYKSNIKSANSPTHKPKIICAICLEQLNTQLVSILCGHYFDWECLQKWEENTCPLCRYHQQPPIITFCQLCNQCEGLWVCLICGVRLCCGIQNNILGEGSHIYCHFKQTGHSLSMQLQTKFLFDARIPAFLHQIFYHQIKSGVLKNNENKIQEQNQQQMINVNSLKKDQKKQNRFQGKQGTKNKIRVQIQQYQKNVTQQMHHQRQYYEGTINKIIKNESQKIRQKKQLIEKLKRQIQQLENQEEQLQKNKISMNQSQANLQKELQIVKNLQKMLLTKIQQKKQKNNGWQRQKQKELTLLNEQIKGRREQLKDFRKNIQVRQRMKNKLKGQTVQGQIVIGHQKKGKKKK